MGTQAPPAKTKAKSQLEHFAEYLVNNEHITDDALKRVFMLQAQWDKRIGQLGIIKGYIKPQTVFANMCKQLEDNRRFGEMASEKEDMSDKEIKDLLAIQKSRFRLFLEALVHSRTMKKRNLKEALKAFLDASKKEEEQINQSEEEVASIYHAPIELLKKPKAKISPHEMKERLKEIKTLSALPEVVQRVISLLSDRSTDLKEIASVASTDVGLTASMLRMCNSASMAMRTEVDSLDKAVVILGFEGIRRCVLAASVIDKFKLAGSTDGKAVWNHAVLTGTWARLLIRKANGTSDEAEDAFTGGLLHDLGKFAIWEYYPKIGKNVQNAIRAGLSPMEAERVEMGMSHPEIGGFLCHFWGFPEALEEAIAYHHAAPASMRNLRNPLPLTRVVNIACRLANLEYLPSTEEDTVCINPSPLDQEFVSFHNLDLGFIAKEANDVYFNAQEIIEDLL